MDYKKKYKDALERARKCLDEKRDTCFVRPDVIFPELAQSEDEKIRKVLIDLVKSKEEDGYMVINNFSTGSILAWLEKQGKQKDINPTLIEKEKMDDAFTKMMFKDKTAMEVINEEKVDNADKVEPKFKVGDVIIWDGEEYTIEKVRENTYRVGGYDVPIYKQLKSPIKFKVGDWIVGANSVYKVVSLNDELSCYIVINVNNEETKIPYYFDCGPNHMCSYHLWTIDDARDGDVLVDVYGNIGIFDKCYDLDWMSCCSLGNNGGFQYFTVEHENEKTYPATKEQRDILFAKMKEAGYEWDAEKKEVKKIEEKPKWIEEDEKYLLVCKNALRKYQVSDKWDADIISKWLEDKLKQGKQGEKTSKWTEEDEKRLQSCISTLRGKGLMGGVDTINTKWLKSLKQRMEEKE